MADPTDALPPGFQIDATPAPSQASSSLPPGFSLDNAATMASDWRRKTGAAPDVPTPFDNELPTSIPTKTLMDRAQDFSSAAGDTLTGGIENQVANIHLLAGGLSGALGNQSDADTNFATVQQERADAARLQAQGAGTSQAGATTGNVLSYVPAMLTGGTTAGGIIGGNQAIDTATGAIDKGASSGQAEKAFFTALPMDVAVNEIPGQLPGGPVAGRLLGATAGAAGQAGAQEVQHLVSPDYVDAPNLKAASDQAGINLLSSILLGGKGDEQPPQDPFLRNYEQSGGADQAGPPAQKLLPQPDPEASPIDPQPPKPAPTVDPTVFAEESFKQDPATALKSLDPATLKQVAEASDVDVHPNDTHAQIADKIVATGPDYLQSAVLPEYLATLPRTSEGSAAAAEPEPLAPTSTQGVQAAPIPPGTTIPVDATGTAYTPSQGAATFSQALDQARGQSNRLPAPVTTVDTQGNAVDSASFNKALQDAQARQQQKADLGLTPDIERAQQVRAAGQPPELATQSDDDSPPWWMAGQDAAEQHARMAGISGLKAEVPNAPNPLPATTPVNTDHDVPLGGGVAKDNSQIYIDKGIPQYISVPKEDGSGDAQVDVHKDIAFHESAEKPELDQGTHYYDAHEENANAAEDAYLRQKYGVTRPAVDKALKPYLDAAAAKNPETSDIPADLDRKPYEDGGDTDMLPVASNELAKIGIPEELHPQALDFLDHVNRALNAGVEPKQLQDIARTDDDYDTKVAAIQKLTTEKGGYARTGHPETQEVSRQAATASHGEAGEAGNTASQQALAEDHDTEPGSGRASDEAGASGQQAPSSRTDVRGQRAELPERERAVNEDLSRAERTIVPPEDRRADWTPQLEGRAITSIDDLVERYGGSTLADSIAQDLREHQVSQLIGKNISSPEDLAAMASVYRNPSFETFRYIFTDDAGNVLGETAVSSRMPSTTQAFPLGTTDPAEWIKSVAPEGATKVWANHNHPSGNPKASKADIKTTGYLAIKLMDTPGAPKLAGHVILDHDTFGYIDPMGEDMGVQKLGSAPTIDPTRYGRGDFQMFEHKVNSPEFAAYTGKRIAEATPKDHSAIVVMDAQRNVVSVHTFSNEFLSSPRGAAVVSRLGQKRGAVGLGIVMDGNAFVKNRDIFNKAVQRGLFRDAMVVSPTGVPIDITGEKLFPQSLRKNFGQQSAATRKRSVSGIRAFEQTPDTQTRIPFSVVRQALADRGMSPEAIKAMTHEQLVAERDNLRRRSEPTPEETQSGDATFINKATVQEERAMKGKAALEFDLRRSNPAALREAQRELAADPSYGTKLASEMVRNPRPLTSSETAALKLDKLRIKNETDQATEALKAAQAKGDDNAASIAMARRQILDAQMDNNQVATTRAGGLAGQTLQSFKHGINDDYSLATVTSNARIAKGSDLTAGERARLEARVAEVEKREQAVAEREKALQDQRREPRAPKERTQAKSKFDSLAEQLKKIAQKEQMKPGCIV